MKIKMREKLAYAVGDVGTNLAWTFPAAFLSIYLTDIVGISAKITGTIFLIARLLDGASDLVMGIIVDKTHTRMGKARPWILWSTLPMAICVVLLFNVPGALHMDGKILYVGILYTLLGAVFYTANNTAYNTMTSLIATDSKDRVQLNSMRFLFAMATVLTITTFTVNIMGAFGGGQTGYTAVSIIFAAGCVVAFAITFFGTREKTEYFQRTSETGEPKISLKTRIMLLARNKYFLLAVLLFLAYYGISAFSNVSVYYSQYVLGDANLMGMLSLATYIPQVIGMLFIAPILSKFGKRFCCLLGLGVSLLGYFICAVGATALPALLTGLCIKNIGMVPITAALIPFVADTVEYGDWKTGHRIEGTTYSCTSFGIKVGSGLGGALMGWLLDAGGYIPNAAAQTESALFAMKGLYIYLPAILSLGLGVILYFFDVEKIYPKIEADLKARKESCSQRS